LNYSRKGMIFLSRSQDHPKEWRQRPCLTRYGGSAPRLAFPVADLFKYLHFRGSEHGAWCVFNQLAVNDIAASRAFYEKFGFKAFARDAARHWLILTNGPRVIGLFPGMFKKNTLTSIPADQHV
jgi:hypothetical protein